MDNCLCLLPGLVTQTLDGSGARSLAEASLDTLDFEAVTGCFGACNLEEYGAGGVVSLPTVFQVFSHEHLFLIVVTQMSLYLFSSEAPHAQAPATQFVTRASYKEANWNTCMF